MIFRYLRKHFLRCSINSLDAETKQKQQKINVEKKEITQTLSLQSGKRQPPCNKPSLNYLLGIFIKANTLGDTSRKVSFKKQYLKYN